MILLTGWTGNTGSLVLERLLERGISPERIVGITRREMPANPFRISQETVHLEDERAISGLFEKYKFEAIIHIANIRYSPLFMKLADRYRVPRVILVHTTGVYSKYNEYSNKYREIEADILSQEYSNTSYTILRPTMIYGNDKDHNMHKLIRFLSKRPVFPIFGDGSSLMQPVHVEDLANVIMQAYDKNDIRNEDYDVSGGTVVSYQEVLKLIVKHLNKKVWFLHIPIPLAIGVARVLGILFKKAPIRVEQVKRLQEDKVYSHEKAVKQLGYRPRSFADGIEEEIRMMKNKGMI